MASFLLWSGVQVLSKAAVIVLLVVFFLMVCDFGPGDEWHIPISACMNQTREGYAIRTNSPAKEMLPTGTRLSVTKADSSIEPLKPTETRGARKVFQTH